MQNNPTKLETRTTGPGDSCFASPLHSRSRAAPLSSSAPRSLSAAARLAPSLASARLASSPHARLRIAPPVLASPVASCSSRHARLSAQRSPRITPSLPRSLASPPHSLLTRLISSSTLSSPPVLPLVALFKDPLRTHGVGPAVKKRSG